VPANAVAPGWKALDIGPESVAEFGKHIASASTIVWNGPMGVAEIAEFSRGTKEVGEAIARSGAYTLVGGGDTVAAIDALGLSGFSHVSTGGGATLEYLEGKELPGVAILKEA
jgi:3-phosphoglycerate kinase